MPIRSLVAGMTGTKAVTATPRPVTTLAWVDEPESGGSASRRTSPVTANESGAKRVPVALTVCAPDHLGNASSKPAVPSGAPASRCGGRSAAAAISKLTVSDAKVCETRICAVRLRIWPAMPVMRMLLGW